MQAYEEVLSAHLPMACSALEDARTLALQRLQNFSSNEKDLAYDFTRHGAQQILEYRTQQKLSLWAAVMRYSI